MIDKDVLMAGIDAHTLPTLVVQYLRQLGHPGWSCELPPFLGRETLGLCNYTTKTISILNALVRYGRPEDVLETALHEIAHALAPGAGHGSQWVEKAKSIGLENPKARSKVIVNLPQEIQRILYTHRLCVLYQNGSIELLDEFTNFPRNMRNRLIEGRPETHGRLRWKPL